MKNLLKESFDYSKANGEINIEFDIDSVTLNKLKEIAADNLPEYQDTQPGQILALLFEELKVEGEFENLGEALNSTFQADLSQAPKPCHVAAPVKEMNLKETFGQFFEGAAEFIELLK